MDSYNTITLPSSSEPIFRYWNSRSPLLLGEEYRIGELQAPLTASPTTNLGTSLPTYLTGSVKQTIPPRNAPLAPEPNLLHPYKNTALLPTPKQGNLANKRINNVHRKPKRRPPALLAQVVRPAGPLHALRKPLKLPLQAQTPGLGNPHRDLSVVRLHLHLRRCFHLPPVATA